MTAAEWNVSLGCILASWVINDFWQFWKAWNQARDLATHDCGPIDPHYTMTLARRGARITCRHCGDRITIP